MTDRDAIYAAWRSIPAEMRDHIGFIAVDMVFQGFVSGDGYVPKDRAVSGWSKSARAIRDAATDASNTRLGEIYRLVERMPPGLFGKEGYNPAWCPNAGPRP